MERGREAEFPKFLSKPVETKRVAREERRRRAVNNWQRRAVLVMAGDGGDKLEGICLAREGTFDCTRRSFPDRSEIVRGMPIAENLDKSFPTTFF